MQIVRQHSLLRLVLEILLADPLQVSAGPARLAGVDPPVPQEKLAQLVARAPLDVLGIFSRALQVAHRFRRAIGHYHRREVAGAQEPRQLHSVAPIRLHSRADLLRDQRGRHDDTRDTGCIQVAVQPVARRSRLVAAPHLCSLAQPAQLLEQQPRVVGNRPDERRLASLWIRDCNRNAVLVDIKTHAP